MIYFDNAATTLIKPPGVAERVSEALSVMGNPGRGGHSAARLAADAVFGCRLLASEFFDVSPDHVIFTYNATHALNIAIQSLVPPKSHVVISGFEHNSVTRLLTKLQAEISVAANRLFDPQFSIDSIAGSIRPDTAAVIVNHVSNVFGYIQPIDEIAGICRKKHVPLIIDAAQSAGVLPVSLAKTGAAFIAMPGHKALFGPQGTGLLLCGRTPEPLLYGGTGSYSMLDTMPEELPDRIEAGTLNVPGICGLAEGLRYVMTMGLPEIFTREQKLLQDFVKGMQEIGSCRIISSDLTTQIGAVSVVFHSLDCELAAAMLSDAEIAVRSGLHCSPLAHRSAGTAGSGTVRFSFSAMNRREEVQTALSRISALNEMKKTKRKL